MTIKEYLFNVKKRDIEILAIKDMILETETMLTRISPILSDLPHVKGNNDKMGNGISRLIEFKEMLNKKIDTACEEKYKTIKEIESMENPSYRTILYERYINHKSFEEISIQMGYSYYHVCRLHGQSLQEFQKVISKK